MTILFSQSVLPPDGTLINGKIVVTISSGALTVALKQANGNDATASLPISVVLGRTLRQVTGALSVTISAGTNTFNAGSASLATNEVDYFVYAVYDSNSSVVALSISRFPYGRVVSAFNSTTTNEKYLGNYANFTSTDEVALIGRIAATLSAGAGYTWTSTSATAPTNLNTVQHPIFETRVLSWSPSWTNFTVGNGTVTATYQIIGRRLYSVIHVVLGTTSSVGGVIDLNYPITRTQTTQATLGSCILTDTGTANYFGEVYYLNATTARLVVRNTAGTYETISNTSATVPHTWAATDLIDTEYQYSIG